ncbi:hypothetical protein DSUL_60089 [Desulfovibrionales bacterium]
MRGFVNPYLTRKSRFGFKRNAQDMVEHGAKRLIKQQQLKGRTWWSDNTTYPIAAADITQNIKLTIMGYQGVLMIDLPALIEMLPIELLTSYAKMAHTPQRPIRRPAGHKIDDFVYN